MPERSSSHAPMFEVSPPPRGGPLILTGGNDSFDYSLPAVFRSCGPPPEEDEADLFELVGDPGVLSTRMCKAGSFVRVSLPYLLTRGSFALSQGRRMVCFLADLMVPHSPRGPRVSLSPSYGARLAPDRMRKPSLLLTRGAAPVRRRKEAQEPSQSHARVV